MVIQGHGLLLTSTGAINIYSTSYKKQNMLEAQNEAARDM